MKRIISLALVILMISVCFTSCSKEPPKHEDLDFSQVDIAEFTETDKETDYVIITVADYGQIVIRLFPDVAPITVKNFKKLVSEHFYDGLIFHRVIEGFMIQGGGYTEKMTQKQSTAIKGEFSSNGVENNLRHIPGVISMARTSVKDSATSQFFIMHKESPHLDGEYAAFGYTVYGIDVVNKIAEVQTNSSDRPTANVVITSIRFAERAE